MTVSHRQLLFWILIASMTLVACHSQAQDRRILPPKERTEMSAEEELSLFKGAMRAGLVAGLLAFILYLMSVDSTLIGIWAFFGFMGMSFHPVAGLLVAGLGVWVNSGEREDNVSQTDNHKDLSGEGNERETSENVNEKDPSDDGNEERSPEDWNQKNSPDRDDELDDLPF